MKTHIKTYLSKAVTATAVAFPFILGAVTGHANVFMFDAVHTTAAIYTGNNSPGHTSPYVDSTNTDWRRISSGSGAAVFGDLTINWNYGRSHNNALNAGVDFSLAKTNQASTAAGPGVFSTSLTGNYIRGRQDGDGRNVGFAFDGLPAGIYDVFVVLHNPDSLTSANNVGIGVLNEAPPTSSATALSWTDNRLTQVNLPANPPTNAWVVNENFALVQVTITDPAQYLYVIGGAFGVSESAISSIQIVAIPEPSTYAALFGLGALALIVLRRFRR
ncbi:MAG: PEP-CTERM sorting domain-containing protein [Opitutales bacterium]|nr:PEP-CTERM sorting domain-containing protein [Opitutales bacterium]